MSLPPANPELMQEQPGLTPEPHPLPQEVPLHHPGQVQPQPHRDVPITEVDSEQRAVVEGRKLFVGGLSYSTTDDGLKNYFLRFGGLEESMVMREKATGRSRGFGFVTFQDKNVADQVVADKTLMLDGRPLHPQVALPKGSEKQRPSDDKVQKLYVGGVSYDTTDDGFKNFFLKYGAIDDCVVMRDKITGESRGFGFVTFTDKESMQSALDATDTLLDGRNLDIKLAIPREEMERQEREKQYGRDLYRSPPVKKVFVRGLADKTTQVEFETYFTEFGTISDAVIMVDRETNNPRGFGFVTFENESSVDKVVGRSHTISGKLVTCEKAKPREPKRPEPVYDPRYDQRVPVYDRGYDPRGYERAAAYRSYPAEPAREYAYPAYTTTAQAGYDPRAYGVPATTAVTPGTYEYPAVTAAPVATGYPPATGAATTATGYATRTSEYTRAPAAYQTRDRSAYHPYRR